MEKACAPTVVEVDTDEEAEMDILPPSPTAPASPHSPPLALSAAAITSSAPLDWYNDLSQRIDMLNLDLRALSEEQDRRLERLIIVLECWSPNMLRFCAS